MEQIERLIREALAWLFGQTLLPERLQNKKWAGSGKDPPADETLES